MLCYSLFLMINSSFLSSGAVLSCMFIWEVCCFLLGVVSVMISFEMIVVFFIVYSMFVVIVLVLLIEWWFCWFEKFGLFLLCVIFLFWVVRVEMVFVLVSISVLILRMDYSVIVWVCSFCFIVMWFSGIVVLSMIFIGRCFLLVLISVIRLMVCFIMFVLVFFVRM